MKNIETWKDKVGEVSRKVEKRKTIWKMGSERKDLKYLGNQSKKSSIWFWELYKQKIKKTVVASQVIQGDRGRHGTQTACWAGSSGPFDSKLGGSCVPPASLAPCQDNPPASMEGEASPVPHCWCSPSGFWEDGQKHSITLANASLSKSCSLPLWHQERFFHYKYLSTHHYFF